MDRIFLGLHLSQWQAVDGANDPMLLMRGFTMRWLERLLFFALGVAGSSSVYWWHGAITIGGDFQANVAGAAIGGLISVGLALLTFRYERRNALADAMERERTLRKEAIREALRHVRSVRECIHNARAITTNSKHRNTSNIDMACALSRKKLNDSDLTDLILRNAIKDTIDIAIEANRDFMAATDQSVLKDPDQIIPGADRISQDACKKIDDIIDQYSTIRALPSI